MGAAVQSDFVPAVTARPVEASTPTARDWREALVGERLADISKYRLAERVLARGQPLFAQGEAGDYAYVALAGWVALEHVLPNGSSQIVDFALPGALLGHQRGPDGAFTVSAQCVTDCWVIVFQRRRLLDLVRGHDALYRLYETTLAEDAARVQRRLANVTRRRGVDKLADLIVELYDRASAVAEDEDPATLPVSQTQFAAALGLTNVYVSRVAKALTDKGLIAWRKRRLHVLNPEGLRAITRAG
jgi:CRP-like cAMP-binding protein